MFYFAILLFLLYIEYIVIFNSKLKSSTQHNLFSILVCIEISLFIGMRDVFTTIDTPTYLRYYYDVGNPSAVSIFQGNEMEWGYTLVNKVVYWFVGYRPTIILTVLGALTICPVIWTVREHKYIFLSIVIWCVLNGLTSSLGIIRQGIALSWCLVGYYYLMNHKKQYAFISLFIATLFHFSAICMFATFPLFYIARKIKLTFPYLCFFILPISVAIILLIRPILKFLVETGGVYVTYLERQNSAIGAILYCVFTMIIFIFSYSAYYYSYLSLSIERRTNFKFLLLMALAGFVMYCATISGGSNRMSLYFTSIYIWLIPLTLSVLEKHKKLHLAFTFCIYFGLGMVLVSFWFFPSSFSIRNYTPFFIDR